MSWIDRVQTDYTITCGDGKSYSPLWLNASKSVEYNIAEFEFKEVAGTLVKRGTPRGRRYPIELYFQGEDHLDTAKAFETSAADPKPWTIAHPLYGSILVQPVSLNLDNADYNVTVITGTVIETISETPDNPTVSAPDKILADKADTDAALATTYAEEVPVPKVDQVKDMISNAAGTYNSALNSIKEAVDVEGITNAYNVAIAAIADADINTVGAIGAIQGMLSLPLKFQDTVINRLGMLGNMLAYLAGTIPGINDLAGKKLYENNAGTVITSMIAAAVTNITGAYPNRGSVLDVIGSILSGYNDYIANLNALQSLNGGLLGAYIPNVTAIRMLSQLVSYGVGVLLDIAASSRQERTLLLAERTNIILLAHQLYGLKEDDSTIDELVAVNNIGLSELLELKKGRKITYYV